MKTRHASRALVALAFALVTLVSMPLRAHEGENGPHGGPMLEVGEHHVELTASGNDLTLYLMDAAHAATPSKGTSGRVVVLDGSKQATAVLEPRDPNLLAAKLEQPLTAGARVVVTAKLGDGRSLVARFVWK